jgi:hypothetical protein
MHSQPHILNSQTLQEHSEQLDNAKTQIETNQRRHQHEQAERRKHAVESQLCSVIAPIRRESESPGSDVA